MFTAKCMFRACLLLDWSVSFAEGLANMVRYARMLGCSMVSVLTNSPLGFLREIIYIFLLRILSQNDSRLVFCWLNLYHVHSL